MGTPNRDGATAGAPEGSHANLRTPSAWVARFAGLVPLNGPGGGTVLDLACGSGRHALLFLRRGHRVVAIDRDVGRIQDLAGMAGLEILEADLEDGMPWPLGGRRFGGVVVANYLHRPLFPHIVDAVAEGGVLLYETFARGNEHFGHPTRTDFLLREGELLEVVRERFSVVAYEHGIVRTPRPAVVQRIAAVRGSAKPRPLDDVSGEAAE